MLNFGDMLGKLKEMQAEMEKTRERLENIVIEADAGAGMVRVKVNGNRKLLKVEIDPELVQRNDREMIEDLVVAAVNKAMQESETRSREELQRASQGMLPNIPGMDLSKLGF